MSRYVFPGHPAYLETAAAELGHPESAAPARRIAALTSMANLCAQAALAQPGHVAGILAKAAEFRDQIATALRAADLMLADVEAGRQQAPGPDPASDVDPEGGEKPPAPLSGRVRQSRNPRDRS